MIKIARNIALVALPAMLLGGCAANCITVASASNNTAYVGSSNGQVSVDIASSDLVGNLIRGSAQIANRTSESQQVKYKFEWSGVNGLPQGYSAPWEPITIGPHMSRVVSSVSPDAAATDFKVLVCK